MMVKPADAPDSYLVQFENGAILRRTCSAFKVRSSPTYGNVHSIRVENGMEKQTMWSFRTHPLSTKT